MSQNTTDTKNGSIDQLSVLKQNIITGVIVSLLTLFVSYLVVSSSDLLVKTLENDQLDKIYSKFVKDPDNFELLIDRMEALGKFKFDEGHGGTRESTKFSSYSNFDLNRSHEAKTDGLVVVLGQCKEIGEFTITGFTDNSQSPKNKVAIGKFGGTSANDFASFTFPVQKGNYWRVDTDEENCTLKSTVSWVAIQ